MEAQARLADGGVRPDLLHQLPFAQRLAGSGHQGDEDVQGAPGKSDVDPVPGEPPLAWAEGEGTEGHLLASRRIDQGAVPTPEVAPTLGDGRRRRHACDPTGGTSGV